MAGFAAFDDAQNAAINEPMDGWACGAVTDTNTAGEPVHGEAEAAFAFETTVPEKMGVNGAVDGIESEVRHEEVIELFPHQCGIELFVVHG